MKKIFLIIKVWKNSEAQFETMVEGSAFLSEGEANKYCDKFNQSRPKYLWYDYREITLKTLDKSE